MRDVAIQLRAMQLFSHSAHNLCSRVVFLQDHSFFGDVYPALESDYDSVVERIIGTRDESLVRLQDILQGVSLKLQAAPSIGVKENALFYQFLLKMEQELCMLIEKELQVPGISSGISQLLGEIVNQSEIRQYKTKQRLKK